MKKNSRADDSGFNHQRGRSVLVAALLIFVALLSAGSGIYAGASFFAEQGPNVTITTTLYTTTTSWTTSTIWSTVTEVVEGILTTIEYTTSTSTVTMTQVPTTITITQLTTRTWLGRTTVTVTGSLTDAYGQPLQGMPVRILLDGQYQGTSTTGSTGVFSYSWYGPRGSHTVTVIFDGNSSYSPSQASQTYSA